MSTANRISMPIHSVADFQLLMVLVEYEMAY